MRLLLRLCVGASLLCALATPGAAQVRLYGQVVDNESGRPIPGAQVILLDAQGRWTDSQVANEDGSFDFVVKQRGPYRLRGSRIGFRENTTPRLYLGEHSTVRVELRLDVSAVLLAPLEVVARSPAKESPVLENFRARLRSGLGTFVTREDIARRQPNRVTDLLATVSGVRLEAIGRGGAQQRVVYLRQNCPALIYVDGLLLNRPGASLAIDDVVAPGNVEGIEIYGGYGSIPAEFLNPEARCGVVAIWTRRGGLSDQAPPAVAGPTPSVSGLAPRRPPAAGGLEEPVAEGPQRWAVAALIGPVSRGPAAEMEAAILSSDFGDTPRCPGCPETTPPGSSTGFGKYGIPWQIDVRYRHTPWLGAALTLGNAAIGHTTGFREIGASGSYLMLDYGVAVVAAGVVLSRGPLSLETGPALYRATVSQEASSSQAGDATSETKLGPYYGLRLSLPLRRRLQAELRAQYRAVGEARVGPFTAVGRTFETTAGFSHWFIGLGLGLAFHDRTN